MCIRDSIGLGAGHPGGPHAGVGQHQRQHVVDQRLLQVDVCLLYTSDAADERSSVDLGGRRILKKEKILHY